MVWIARSVFTVAVALLGVAVALPVAETSPGFQRTSRPVAIERGEAIAPLVVTKGKANGAIVSPGQLLKLKVLVADRSGTPIPGASVLFIAPDRAPTAVFAGGATFIRALTKTNGIATAKLTAGPSAGPFLVDAVVDGTAASATFAVTIAPSASPPALTASRARSIVREQILFSSVEDETLRLHGPFLLATGTCVVEAVNRAHVAGPVIRPTWLFWIDQEPGALFEHPTRFVLLDSTDPTPDLATQSAVTRQRWWPEIISAGSDTGVEPAPASLLNAAAIESVTPTDFQSSPAAPAPADACAILFRGKDFPVGKLDLARFRRFLIDRSLVMEGKVFTTGTVQNPPTVDDPAATLDDVEKLIAKAKADGCRKVYVVIASHGFDARDGTGRPIRGVVLGRDGEHQEPVSYRTLANRFGELRGAELCVVDIACYSGDFCGWLQGLGLKGFFVSSASNQNVCFIDNPNNTTFFGAALLKCWADPMADTGLPAGVSLQEAVAWTRLKAGDDALKPGPKSGVIEESGTCAYPADTVLIARTGDMSQITLRRPEGTAAALPLRFEVSITRANVATFANGMTTMVVDLAAQATEVVVPITATGDGETGYTVDILPIDGKRFHGDAIIRVGGELTVGPNPMTIDLTVTTMRTAVIFREGVLRQTLRKVTLCATSSDATIAMPTADMIAFPDQQFTELPIKGLKPGQATIEFKDKPTGITTKLTVVVKSATVCPLGVFTSKFTVKEDPAGHDPFIMLRCAWLAISEEDGEVMITSDAPQVPMTTGMFDAKTCELMTTGMGMIAGIPNVRCEFRDVRIVDSARGGVTIEGDYVVGTGGELPTGRPIKYHFTGALLP